MSGNLFEQLSEASMPPREANLRRRKQKEKHFLALSAFLQRPIIWDRMVMLSLVFCFFFQRSDPHYETLDMSFETREISKKEPWSLKHQLQTFPNKKRARFTWSFYILCILSMPLKWNVNVPPFPRSKALDRLSRMGYLNAHSLNDNVKRFELQITNKKWIICMKKQWM